MQFIIRRPWDLPQRAHTPIDVYRNRKHHRREFLKRAGLTAAGIGMANLLSGCSSPNNDEIEAAGAVPSLPTQHASAYPAQRNREFDYGRPKTVKRAAAEYTNFYEFSSSKDNWRHVENFKVSPWSFEVDGLCSKPQTFDMDDVYQSFSLQERAYRHRCVETWAMCAPWTGFPFHELLKLVEPKPAAKYVTIESFNRPDEAPAMQHTVYPWPYSEALSIEEATNELAFVATGIYGAPLPKQHGAPIRLVVPWKYGFKSIKSIVRITLTESQPPTFWNQLAPHEYGFEANVDPDVPHPRWSQRTEWMLGTNEEFETTTYNGYGEFVGKLYQA